ncbi:ABC transporter substrate-binding protein [Methanocaldococcus infernus]
MNIRALIILLLCGALIGMLCGCTTQEKEAIDTKEQVGNKVEMENYKVVKDMWGRDVKIKNNVERVALIDFTGTYIKVLKIWDMDDRVVAVDHSQKKNEFLRVICPRIENIVDVGSSKEINYETLASTKPDVVIIRAFVTNKEREDRYKDMIQKLDEMNIPVVILLHPTSFDKPDVKTMWEEIRILGQIFNKEKEADDLINYLNNYVKLISDRTKDIPEDKRPRVLLFATPDYMLGPGTIQSYFLEEIVHGKNVLKEGRWLKTSPEQVLKLNPDALIILGHAGYVSPEEVYEGKDTGFNWKLVQDINAIKNRKVGSLGITEWRATIEFPIGLLREAKTLYPERFTDIDPDKEEIKLYKELYKLDDNTLQEAIKAQRYRGNPH